MCLLYGIIELSHRKHNDLKRTQAHPSAQSFKSTNKNDNPEYGFSKVELENAISKLNESLRIPLQMSLYGYKYEEISDKLNLKLGTVKSRISLSKQKLREIMN